MKIFATCLRALDSLMTYELLASNINARCMHILLTTRVHSTRGAHEEFVYIKLFHTYLPSNVTSKSHAKQKHLGCKKVRGQSEATLQTGRRDQNV